MSGIFAAGYAKAYDRIYRDKDYAGECALIEALFDRHGKRPVRSLLDLGCGTGTHALELARRGVEVTGVDRSAAMLAVARGKLRREPALLVGLVEGDIRSARLGRRFDAVLMMFAVLGYLASDDEQRAALATVSEHLEPGGLFVFDVWYGPAVEAQGPSRRESWIDASGRVRRLASGELDRAARVCEVTIELREGGVATALAERHRVRYFFADELATRLAAAGLDLVSLTAFPTTDRPPDESTWNVLGVARLRRPAQSR